jgi:hypothetical protein
METPASLSSPITIATASGTDWTSGTDYDALNPLAIGARSNDANYVAASMKDVMIFDEPLTTTQILELLETVTYAPGLASRNRRIGIGVGVGLSENSRPTVRAPDEFTLTP